MTIDRGTMKCWISLVFAGTACLAGPGAAFAAGAVVTVDPGSPALTGVTGLGEWNTNGNFGGWRVVNSTSASVASGSLRAVDDNTGTVAPRIERTGISAGPNLDLGYNDRLEIRIKVPSTYTGSISISWGTNAEPSFATSRLVTIPAELVRDDGNFHVYRVDMGLEQRWRGTLTDLRIEPMSSASGAGGSYEIDYVRVGDLQGDAYQPDYRTLPRNAPGTFEMESKRFRVIWSQANATAGFDAAKARGTLRNLEETWQVFTRLLAMREPNLQDGVKYKLNLTTYEDGYWESGRRLNIDPSGLQVDPPSWVIPHELMHAYQESQGGSMDGMWWESHANYGRERWLQWYRHLFSVGSNLDSYFEATAHWYHGAGRHTYLAWPIFLYLDENPDRIPGLGNNLSARIWQEIRPNEHPLGAVARLVPGVPLKNLIGYFARRNVTWNYAHKADLNAAVSGGDEELLRRWKHAELRRRADDPSWWQVPPEMAPMQGAYAVHELVPTGTGSGRVVTVNLRGIPMASRGADLRASLVIVSDTGVERYSPLWNSGSTSVTLGANENQVYLVVAATPDDIVFGNSDDLVYPHQSHPSKTRFLYEVQLTGATPRELQPPTSGSGRAHPNGGGFVADTAVVDASAYVAPGARVLGAAQVRGNAQVLDYAVVQDSAQVLENAVVSGHSLVRGGSVVRGWAKVRDYAIVTDATITESARILEHATVDGGAVVKGFATAKGNAGVYRNESTDYVGGDAVLDGDYSAGLTVTNGFQFGFVPWVATPPEWVAQRTAPARLYAAHEFNTPHDSLAQDLHGTAHGRLVGAPTCMAGDGSRPGFFNFNGSSQYILLDRSVSDLREATVSAWVKPSASTSGQVVFSFGSASDRYIALSTSDGSGRPQPTARSGSTTQRLLSPSSIPTNAWTHLTATLAGGVGKLYVNGVLRAQGPIALRPDQVTAGNKNTDRAYNYIGRGPGSERFRGAIDSFRVYSKALVTSEIADLLCEASELARWELDETSGTVAEDTSCRGRNDAVVVGGAAWRSYAIELDGVNDAIQTPVANGSARTLSAWIYPQSRNTGSIFDTDIPSQYGTGWSVGDGRIYAILDDQFWDTGVSVALNTWQHVALAFDRSTAKVYRDGDLAATLSYTQGPVTSASYDIGRSPTRGEHFRGMIRDARIFDRALKGSEISEVFAGDDVIAPTGVCE